MFERKFLNGNESIQKSERFLYKLEQLNLAVDSESFR